MGTTIDQQTADWPGLAAPQRARPAGQFRKLHLGKLLLSLALVAVLVCAVVPFVGATAAGAGGIHHGEQPPYAKTPWGDDRIHLANRNHATNPTWEQLLAFLRADITDERAYNPLTFPCGAFAEELHNNAEARGIRAAWVVVAFASDEQGHALNAFQTTDRGLVWIDSSPSWSELYSKPRTTYAATYGTDKVACVAIGARYGVTSAHTSADKGTSTAQGLQYDGGDTYSLGTLAGGLTEGGDASSPNWGSLGTVTDIQVYW